VRVGEELVPGFSAPSTICKAETVQLFPGDFAQYIWSTGDTIPAITAANTGIYAVTVVDEDGCTATAAHPLLVAELAISAEHKEPDCYGYDNGEIYLDASGSLPPFLFSFDNMPFQSARKYIGLKAGLYNVEVKDSLGCKQEGTVYLHSPPEFILDVNCETALDLGGNTIIQTQSSLPIVDYHWSPKAGLDCSDCPSPRAKPLSSTLYTLSAMSEQGCEAQAQVFIAVEKSREVYVPNAFSPNGDGINDFFSIYPGPSVLKINYLKIFDRWGDAVFSAWNIPPFHAAGHWDGSYRGRPMQPGAFAWFAEIEFLDGHITLLKGDVVLLK
jgi:gliding motility-associated-like protein